MNEAEKEGLSVELKSRIQSRKKRFELKADGLLERGRADSLRHARDIVAANLLLERAHKRSLIDSLTGLYNRRAFLTLARQQLKLADREGKRIHLLFADFDGLKQINDAFGHPEGDRALIEVADVLRKTFRESDIVARIGGDEFLVMAMETEKPEVESGDIEEILTNRLQETLDFRNAEAGRCYKRSLSIGIVPCDPNDSRSLKQLIHQADRAMYEKKQGYQNQQV